LRVETAEVETAEAEMEAVMEAEMEAVMEEMAEMEAELVMVAEQAEMALEVATV
jgi:hypothetical protein